MRTKNAINKRILCNVTKSIVQITERFFIIGMNSVMLQTKSEVHKMKTKIFRSSIASAVFISSFVAWTVMIKVVDVRSIGPNGTSVGFASVNNWFHSLTGVNMTLYNITDWLGLVPIFVCMIFGAVAVFQLFKRKSILKIDYDIIVLGVYYVAVILFYLVFEMIPVNYRPVLINGCIEASYPSSTTLLVLCVMSTLVFQVRSRVKNKSVKRIICAVVILFSVFMVAGRLVSGVHWITDIVGATLLSAGLYNLYKSVVLKKLLGE